MKTTLRVLLAPIFLLSCSVAFAATTQTTGAGSAVGVADRTATFDSITTDSIDLSAYSEDGLDITVGGVSHVGFDAFGEGPATQLHYASSGNTSYVTIKASDAAAIFALEARVGDGWTAETDLNVYWETWSGGALVSSGQYAGAIGDVLGWIDPAGFDELRVAAYDDPATAFGGFQAIALDDVSVQLGGIIIRIFEDAGNVEATMNGSIELAALGQIVGTSLGFDGYDPSGGHVAFTADNTDYYAIGTTWTPFGTGTFDNWDTSSGDSLALFSGSDYLGVPTGYVSGSPLSATATKNVTTLAALGMTPGTYTTIVSSGEVSDSVTVIVGSLAVEEADLTISKLDSPDPVVAGTNLTYTIRVDNIGDAAADDVVVTDNLPSGVTFVSTTGCTEDPAGMPTCSLGTIDAGGFAQYTMTIMVDPSMLASVVNTATVVTSSTESDDTNNSATAETTVNAEADLSITKMDSSDPFVSGGNQMLTYTIEVSNAGPSDATNVVVTDTLSPLVRSHTTSGCLNDPNGVPDCQLGTIPAGGLASYTITVDLSRAGGLMTNLVSVMSDASDPVGDNDSVEEVTEVLPISIPTLNNLGLLVLILLVGGIGWVSMRRL